MKSDPGHPCRKTGSTFKLVQVLVGTNPGLLEDIFRFDVVNDDRTDDAIQALVIAAHQYFVEPGLACAHQID